LCPVKYVALGSAVFGKEKILQLMTLRSAVMDLQQVHSRTKKSLFSFKPQLYIFVLCSLGSYRFEKYIDILLIVTKIRQL
jgi:hypothetical protein